MTYVVYQLCLSKQTSWGLILHRSLAFHIVCFMRWNVLWSNYGCLVMHLWNYYYIFFPKLHIFFLATRCFWIIFIQFFLGVTFPQVKADESFAALKDKGAEVAEPKSDQASVDAVLCSSKESLGKSSVMDDFSYEFEFGFRTNYGNTLMVFLLSL